MVPSVDGMIATRLLVNAVVDAEAVRPLLPTGAEPQLVGPDGVALVGVCVLRVEQLRPSHVPRLFGRRFDGLAYRVGVTRGDGSPGVHIVRRETDDRLVGFLGGRVFPGTHHRVEVRHGDDGIRLEAARDGEPVLVVDVADAPPAASCFRSVLGDDDAASRFFSAASEASSPSRRPGRAERIRMVAPPFGVRSVRVRELVLDRLAWALGGLSPAALGFDSAFLVRDVPVRFSPAPAA